LQILKLAPLSMLVLLSACGSTETKSMHSGDRIQNPNRIVAGAHVRILEVGEGDKRFDSTQSFKGVVCTVGSGGLRNDWSDGFYEGKVVKCSNGDKSYDFTYVKVEKLD
jgi:hypothetical protein